jgi:selenocysteine lyase/cysteine desulfurase
MDRTLTATLSGDLLRWRADTPGCSRVVHLNNAGAALVPRPVRDAVRGHLDLEDQVGGYEAAEAEVASLRATYQAVGRLLGAGAQNVALVQNSTVAFTQAISAFDFGPVTSYSPPVLTTRPTRSPICPWPGGGECR